MSSTPQETQPTRVFVCPHCEQPALGHVRGVAVWDGWDKDSQEIISPEAEYALIQCGTYAVIFQCRFAWTPMVVSMRIRLGLFSRRHDET